MTSNEIQTAIYEGELDADLGRLRAAIVERQKAMQHLAARRMATQIKAGDRIQIKLDAPLRPRYLLGVPMVVDQVNTTRAVVHVEDPAALPSRRYASGITVPLAHCEPVA